jgi:hypothetical protein
MSQQWQYKVTKCILDVDTINRALEAGAAHGWELVSTSVEAHEELFHDNMYLFWRVAA